jgi:hypothetical protein
MVFDKVIYLIDTNNYGKIPGLLIKVRFVLFHVETLVESKNPVYLYLAGTL